MRFGSFLLIKPLLLFDDLLFPPVADVAPSFSLLLNLADRLLLFFVFGHGYEDLLLHDVKRVIAISKTKHQLNFDLFNLDIIQK